jgi:HAD superfamily hydrolase (TIGR01509 family)
MGDRDGRGVIFDLDGVLINSEPTHLRAYQDVLRGYGVQLSDADYYETYLVYSDREVLERLVPDPGRVDEAAAAKSRRYLELIASGVVPFADGLALLGRTEGWRVGLATGSLRREAELALASLGVRERFRCVVSIEECRHGKPAPEPYLLAAAALGVDPTACVAVEDSPGGVQAAKAAGMRCVAVTHTCGRERLREADLVVDDLGAVDLDALLAPGGPGDA